jgi:protein involved in sex pheromone biosynthesis
MKSTVRIALLSLSLILPLTGCSSFFEQREAKIKITTTEKERPALILPQAEQLNLENPTYYVLTPDTTEKIFKEMKERGIEPVIIGTTVEGYSVILTNNVKIRQLMKKYQDDIKAQKKYYTTPVH